MKNLPFIITLLILICISCKKESQQDTLDPCTSNCDVPFSVVWSKPWLTQGEFPIFSPEIYLDKIILGFRLNDAIIVQAVDKNDGSVIWQYTTEKNVEFLRYRFYNDVLALNLKLRNREGQLVLLNMADGSVSRSIQRSEQDGRYFSLGRKQIIYTTRDADSLSFYRIPLSDIGQSILIKSISYPLIEYPYMAFESPVFFTNLDEESFLVTYNSQDFMSYQFDLNRDTLYKIKHIAHSIKRNAIRIEHDDNIVILFDQSQASIYHPRSEKIFRTVSVAYENNTQSKHPVWVSDDLLYLNTTDNQQDILAVSVANSIVRRYTNMGSCDQIKLVDDKIIVTCDGRIYALDSNSDQWLWRNEVPDTYPLGYGDIRTSPAIDTITGNLYFFQGLDLVCVAWPE